MADRGNRKRETQTKKQAVVTLRYQKMWVNASNDRQRPLRQSRVRKDYEITQSMNYIGSLQPLAWPCYQLFKTCFCFVILIPLSLVCGLSCFPVSPGLKIKIVILMFSKSSNFDGI